MSHRETAEPYCTTAGFTFTQGPNVVENYQKSLNYTMLFRSKKPWENVSFSSDFRGMFTEKISGFAPCDLSSLKE